MAKKTFSHIAKVLVVAIALFLCTVLFFNISTIILAKKIQNGQNVQSGYSLAIVSSGSMEPTLNKNDLIIIKGSNDYTIQDVAAYVSEKGTLITHRIIEISDSGYTLQGDANNTVDKEIHKQRFLGKVGLVIPNVGGILTVLSSPIGIAFIISFPVGIMLISHFFRKMNSA